MPRSPTKQESRALICEPTQNRLNADVVAEIMRQANGHPFLIQYIMHYLWAARSESANVAKIRKIVEQFPGERDDFDDWCEAIGATGEHIYAMLAERNDWVKRSDIFAQTHEKPGAVKRVLETLTYHGLVHHDNHLGVFEMG